MGRFCSTLPECNKITEGHVDGPSHRYVSEVHRTPGNILEQVTNLVTILGLCLLCLRGCCFEKRAFERKKKPAECRSASLSRPMPPMSLLFQRPSI
jgi:hypothetical protein